MSENKPIFQCNTLFRKKSLSWYMYKGICYGYVIQIVSQASLRASVQNQPNL